MQANARRLKESEREFGKTPEDFAVRIVTNVQSYPHQCESIEAAFTANGYKTHTTLRCVAMCGTHKWHPLRSTGGNPCYQSKAKPLNRTARKAFESTRYPERNPIQRDPSTETPTNETHQKELHRKARSIKSVQKGEVSLQF